MQSVKILYGLKPRRSATAQIRARGATPIRSATGTIFPSDMLSPEARSNLRQAETTANRAPTGPGGLPPYSERDPDPASTMMLERRLASELNELGGLSGFCVESTDPDYLDGIRETRDENESRRFSAGEAGERRSPIEERNRNENAARRLSMPVLPVRRDERREPRRAETDRDRDRDVARDARPREQRREPARGTRREVRDQRDAALRDRRESREAQLRRPSGAHRFSRSGSEARDTPRRSGNSIEFIQPRQRRSTASPTTNSHPPPPTRAPSTPATPAAPAETPVSPTTPNTPSGAPPTALRTPPPLPPRPPVHRASSWLPHPPPLPRIDTESLLEQSPMGAGSGSDSASPRSSASESPVTPVTPVMARAPSPPAYATLDPRAVTRSPPTTSLNVRPRRSLRNPSAPHAPPTLPPVNRLGTRADQRTMGDLMSDIVPVAGSGAGLGLGSPSGYAYGGESVCVPAAISPLGEDMVIPASERYGERYAALAGNAHAAATGNGGRIKNLMKRWSGGNRRMAAA